MEKATDELNEKSEKTGEALGKYVINSYSTGIFRFVKIRDVKKLQEIKDDLIIKDQMANLGCLLVCTFGNFLAPILIAAHTVSNVDFSNEPERPATQHEQNEYYESGDKI